MRQIISVEGLRDWLRTQPPETAFDYTSNTDCLCHRYLTAMGLPVSSVGPFTWHSQNGKSHELPFAMNVAAHYGPTYGDVLRYLGG